MEQEIQESPSVVQFSMKWGLILGLIYIVIAIVLQFAGLAGDQNAGWINLPFLIGIIYMAQKAFKSEGDGYLNYGAGLGLGTMVSIISSIVSGIFSYIYISFIDDSVIEMAREKAYEQWEEQGLTSSQIETAEGMLEAFTSPGAIAIMGILFGIFFGFLVSLIITIFTKNPKPEFS